MAGILTFMRRINFMLSWAWKKFDISRASSLYIHEETNVSCNAKKTSTSISGFNVFGSTRCMLGNCTCFLTFFKKNFQEYYPSVKQLRSWSGQHFFMPDLWPNCSQSWTADDKSVPHRQRVQVTLVVHKGQRVSDCQIQTCPHSLGFIRKCQSLKTKSFYITIRKMMLMKMR